MVDIYRKYRSEAVDRYLLGDNYTLERNNIFILLVTEIWFRKISITPIFLLEAKYYFLLNILPKEIWYMILKLNLPSKRWNM